MAPGNSQYYTNPNNAQYSQDQNAQSNYQSGYWNGSTQQSVPATSDRTGGTASSTSHYGYSNAGTAAYADRSHYDRSNVAYLPSIDSALNRDHGRDLPQTQTYGGYASTNSHEQQQAHTTTQPVAAHGTTQATYGTQQPRTHTQNSRSDRAAEYSNANQNTYNSSTTSQYLQPQQRTTTTTYQASVSPVAQWAPINQRNNHVSQSTTARPSEFAARATSGSQRPRSGTPQSVSSASASVQPAQSAPITVDPHQVYDPYQEYQRKKRAQEKEDEARRPTEAKQAEAKKLAEEGAAAEAKRVADAEAHSRQSQAAQGPTTSAEVLKKKRKRKTDGDGEPAAPQQRKSRKSAPAPSTVDLDDQAAAMTLLQTANAGTANAGTDLESEMKAMFKRMREYNAKNPLLLAKLWQEERDEFLANDAANGDTTAVPPASTTPSNAAGTSATPTTKAKRVRASGKKGTKDITATPGASVPATPVSAPSATTTQQAAHANTIASAAVPTSATSAAPLSSPHTVPQPAPAKSAGTMWPADKKHSLAAAAAKLLQDGNPGKIISPTTISGILDTNPSYLELCQKLDSLGFKINRGDFARALLQAVPDVNRAGQRPVSQSQGGAQQADAGILPANPVSQGEKTAALNSAATRLLNGGSVIASETLASAKPKTPRSRKDTTPRKPNSVNTAPAAPMVIPSAFDPRLEGLDAVKQFVDGQWRDVPSPPVTASPAAAAAASTKPKTARTKAPRPSLPPAPVTKEDLARKRTFADLVDLTAQLESDDEELLQLGDHSSDFPTQMITPPQTEPEVDYKSADNQTDPQRVMPPIAHQRPHPHDAARLPISQPTAASSNFRVPHDHQSRHVIMVQPLDKYKAIRRSTYNPKTIARDVLLACGRHPDMRHLNAHLETLKTAFPAIENSSDLGTFRWDIADPGGPAPGSGVEMITTGFDDFAADADDEDDTEDEPDRLTVRIAVGLDGAPVVEHGRSSAIASFKRSTPRNIRSHAGGVGGASEGDSTPGGAAGYRALRELQAQAQGENGESIKKKGRPVGWRKWMMKGGPPPAGEGSSLGRGKLVKGPPDPEPIYQVYKCQWKDCGAELHNLATLRKHIHKLHGKKSESEEQSMYNCLWNDCGKVKSVNEGGRTISRIVPEEFVGPNKWTGHMEKKHIQPTAWELGDGPTGGLSEREDSELSEAYMSDSRGRRITPAIRAPSPSVPSSLKPMSNAEREARELERLAIKRKREIGPGIDKGGARLANDKRRHGFVDDEEEDQIVDPDD